MEKLLVLILAGGASRRMGRDKAALPFEGGTMLTTLVRRYGEKFPVAVSVGEAGRYDTAGAPEILDLMPGQGPLAGLQAAFAKTDAELIFLTGTDLPFIPAALTEELLRRMETMPEAKALTVVRRDGEPEPLCGLYRRSCVPVLEQYLSENRRSLKGFLRAVNAAAAEEDSLPEFDLPRLLDNLNTPEDYTRAVIAASDSKISQKIAK